MGEALSLPLLLYQRRRKGMSYRYYYYCRWCGEPIKKFLLGWIHVNPFPIGLPQHLHVAQP